MSIHITVVGVITAERELFSRIPLPILTTYSERGEKREFALRLPQGVTKSWHVDERPIVGDHVVVTAHDIDTNHGQGGMLVPVLVVSHFDRIYPED